MSPAYIKKYGMFPVYYYIQHVGNLLDLHYLAYPKTAIPYGKSAIYA